MEEEKRIIYEMYDKEAFTDEVHFDLKKRREIFVDDRIPIKTVKPLFEYGKLNLFVAPTGLGKTFITMKSIKQLSEENPTTCYIVACPNRVQNLQNKQYEVSVIVGGVKENNLKVVSMVYDKALETIEQCKREGREVVLIIDEAHQLIDAYDYRKNAIKGLLQCTKEVQRTLFITATPNKLKETLGIFEYDYIYTIKHKNSDKYKNFENLKVLRAYNTDLALIDIIQQNKEKNIISIIELNNIDQHNSYELLLLKKGFKVTSIHSKNKNSNYDSIIENSIIPDETEVVITTSILECGTNIKNKNISLIAVPNNANSFDLDSLEQFYARAREHNSNAYLILRRIELENFKFKSLEKIAKNLGADITQRRNEMNKAITNVSDTYKKDYIESCIKGIESKGNLMSKDCIIYDIECDAFRIDKYLFTKKVFKVYYEQFYYDMKRLKAELQKRVKAKNINIYDYDKTTGNDKEELKEIRASKKEVKEEIKNKVKQYCNEMLNDTDFFDDFFEYLNDKSFINYSRYKDKLEDMVIEKKTILLIKKLLSLGQSNKESISIIAKSETQKQVQDTICTIGYIKLNKALGEDAKIPKAERIEYFKIRNKLDTIMEKRGRIKKEIQFELALELDMLSKKDDIQKKELSKATGKKLMKVINFIYTTTSLKDGIQINALRKHL